MFYNYTSLLTVNIFFLVDSTRVWDNPYSAQVRLTGGSTVNQGLVEVYCNGQWGTICHSGSGYELLDILETVCVQLGYGDGETESSL